MYFQKVFRFGAQGAQSAPICTMCTMVYFLFWITTMCIEVQKRQYVHKTPRTYSTRLFRRPRGARAYFKLVYNFCVHFSEL